MSKNRRRAYMKGKGLNASNVCCVHVNGYDGLFLETDVTEDPLERAFDVDIIDMIESHYERTDHKSYHVVFDVGYQERNVMVEQAVVQNMMNVFRVILAREYRTIIRYLIQFFVYFALSVYISCQGGDPTITGVYSVWGWDDSNWVVFWAYGLSLVSWYMNWFAIDCIFFFIPGRRHRVYFLRRMLNPSTTITFATAIDWRLACNRHLKSVKMQGFQERINAFKETSPLVESERNDYQSIGRNDGKPRHRYNNNNYGDHNVTDGEREPLEAVVNEDRDATLC